MDELRVYTMDKSGSDMTKATPREISVNGQLEKMLKARCGWVAVVLMVCFIITKIINGIDPKVSPT